MQGSIKLNDLKNMPSIPEYEGIQKDYLKKGLDSERIDPEGSIGSSQSIDFNKLKSDLQE